MKNSILYVQTSDTPERQYSPLILAQTARAMDIKAMVYYLGTGLKVLNPEIAKGIKFGEFPSIYELLKQVIDSGIEVYACKASMKLLGVDNIQLLPGIKIVGAATLNDLALDARATMWF
ncbi:sulfur reduction protein DsrE [candidate division WOR-3 bacterium 4484_100]|uniref:Sulfur reduction protein DsrE n=1 Tax=candidate division WOR-3 bacterium 4484_100 TaxID=1936077 RepID=A0A1V4QFZ2_UNCW3|nr:MAG: sulfur reduction protein DsrE [candidate division WOR-3 bacterium 4484_100]